ncbi:hypothetical protein [uncultured Brevibacillus sp.]|uniref:hypothetical protein n=1 Tax=uncultured Brevibacillus sp. TaxID=169970 RepID=UPI002595283B|nr:hypothetical protein [uncultured Brevibacillus sp.]
MGKTIEADFTRKCSAILAYLGRVSKIIDGSAYIKGASIYDYYHAARSTVSYFRRFGQVTKNKGVE